MNTTYFKNMIAGNIFHATGAAAFPAKYYLGLSSTAPKEDGTGATEPATSGTGYARIEITSLTGPSNGAMTNANDLIFPKSLAEWFPAAAPAINYTVWDGNGSSAHLLNSGTLPEARIVQSNNYVTLPSGSLSLTVI